MHVFEYTVRPTRADWEISSYNVGSYPVRGGRVEIPEDHPYADELISTALFSGFERVQEESTALAPTPPSIPEPAAPAKPAARKPRTTRKPSAARAKAAK